MMEKPQIELLSPAGSLDTLKAVVTAGADAVYAAGNRFGARAFANNFTEEELLYAIDYLHLRGKTLYLTVNTLLREKELEKELYDYMLPLYRQGLDGVIIQDLGVLTFLRQHFPGLELHASTQMSITGPGSAKLLKNLGCNRIVTARELSLQEIKNIHDTVDIEIESFIHGALCYCYSGQCLFSSMLGGRSGNRGRCAQPCRLPYHVPGAKETHLLSPKDLCTIELLPKIIESGVYSLKIEGRMKQAEYAAGVTSIYREYIDRYLSNPTGNYQVEPEDLKTLEALGSRSGFTKGYYVVENGPDMMAMEKPAHTKSNDELQQRMRQRFLQQEKQEKINGILTLSKEKPAELVLKCKGVQAAVTGDMVQQAKSRPMGEEELAERIKKTGGSPFVFHTLDIQMDKDIFMPVGALNQLRREGLSQLEMILLKKYRRSEIAEVKKDNNQKEDTLCVGDTKAERPADSQNHVGQGYLAVGVATEAQFYQVLEYPYVDRIYVEAGALEENKEIPELLDMVKAGRSAGKEIFYVMPMVLREKAILWYQKHIRKLEETGISGFVAGSYEAMALVLDGKEAHTKLLSDSNAYAWSGQGAAALKEMGVDEITLPLEENQPQLMDRGFSGGELEIYGYLPLMISAQCVVKNTRGCKKAEGFTMITDRYDKKFPVKNQCRYCYNVIYNSSPLSLLHQYPAVEKVQAEGYRISFTMENPNQVAEIMNYYQQGFLKKEALDRNKYLTDFTNGHFKRGVE